MAADFDTFGFGTAISILKAGGLVARIGWNGPGQHLFLVRPVQFAVVSVPFIAIRTVQRAVVPWLASQTDMLAEDWTRFTPETICES